ncbi:glycosyltransferase family 4 protein [Aquihabitans daechungensis]|uniref:glycosyltransferase family 4 protein n=1 Tax=Aquihabitans daechungensis TaxID=1052257 RepID=UPI003BA35EFB
MSASADPLAGARVRFGPEIFRIQPRGGASRYVVELHRALLQAHVDSVIVAGWHTSEVLDDVPQVQGRAATVSGLPGANVLTRFVAESVASRAVRRLGPGDIWHPSYYPRRLPTGRDGERPRLVITVLDMIHEQFAASMARRDDSAVRKAAACAAADLVLCISHDTARDLQERLGIDPEKVAVTHLGVTPVEPVSRPRPFGDRPYIVYLGDRRSPYKNWTALLDALRSTTREVDLLCIGAPAGSSDLEDVRFRGLDGRVQFEGGSDAEVAGRLASAAGLVYPSLSEGFGLPPLEALAQGCPVVASDAGAIPEVVGGIAVLVEPSVEGIGAGIERLLAGGPDVERQRTGGPAHAARFTWEATAAATIDGYRRILG